MDVNELRRLLEAGQITPDQLSQMSMSGSFDGGQNALAQMVMPQPRFDVAPMQMNTMRAENGPDAGKVTNLNFTGAPGTPKRRPQTAPSFPRRLRLRMLRRA
jgi:hypothetical protein